MSEVWAGIPSAPGYSVSSTGQVRGPRGKLTTHPTARGYLTCSLRAGGKKLTTTVQRLVLEAFVGPPPTSKHEANHKNGNKADNCPSNLEWVTRQENMDHAWKTGLCKPRPSAPKADPRAAHAGKLWQSVVILGPDGSEHWRIDLYAPAAQELARCDQHKAIIDGKPALVTATQVSAMAREAIAKRPGLR